MISFCSPHHIHLSHSVKSLIIFYTFLSTNCFKKCCCLSRCQVLSKPQIILLVLLMVHLALYGLLLGCHYSFFYSFLKRWFHFLSCFSPVIVKHLFFKPDVLPLKSQFCSITLIFNTALSLIKMFSFTVSFLQAALIPLFLDINI